MAVNTLVARMRPLLIDVLVCFACLAGDFVLVNLKSVPQWYRLRAVSDNMFHGLVAALSWAVVVDFSFQQNISQILGIVICGLLGSVLDLDHFIYAEEFSLKAALSLPKRPPLHSTSLVLAIVLVAYIAQRTLNPKQMAVYPVAAFLLVSWLSHHLRDAHRHGLWFWPIGSTPPIPQALYILLCMVLPLVVRFVISPSQQQSEKTHENREALRRSFKF